MDIDWHLGMSVKSANLNHGDSLCMENKPPLHSRLLVSNEDHMEAFEVCFYSNEFKSLNSNRVDSNFVIGIRSNPKVNEKINLWINDSGVIRIENRLNDKICIVASLLSSGHYI